MVDNRLRSCSTYGKRGRRPQLKKTICQYDCAEDAERYDDQQYEMRNILADWRRNSSLTLRADFCSSCMVGMPKQIPAAKHPERWLGLFECSPIVARWTLHRCWVIVVHASLCLRVQRPYVFYIALYYVIAIDITKA